MPQIKDSAREQSLISKHDLRIQLFAQMESGGFTLEIHHISKWIERLKFSIQTNR